MCVCVTYHAWEIGQLGPCSILTISSAVISIVVVGIGKGEGEIRTAAVAAVVVVYC